MCTGLKQPKRPDGLARAYDGLLFAHTGRLPQGDELGAGANEHQHGKVVALPIPQSNLETGSRDSPKKVRNS